MIWCCLPQAWTKPEPAKSIKVYIELPSEIANLWSPFSVKVPLQLLKGDNILEWEDQNINAKVGWMNAYTCDNIMHGNVIIYTYTVTCREVKISRHLILILFSVSNDTGWTKSCSNSLGDHLTLQLHLPEWCKPYTVYYMHYAAGQHLHRAACVVSAFTAASACTCQVWLCELHVKFHRHEYYYKGSDPE